MREQVIIRENDDFIIQVDYDEDEGVSGKYWVVQKNKTGRGKHIIVTRIFDTETAWSNAERHANDLLRQCGFNYTHTINL